MKFIYWAKMFETTKTPKELMPAMENRKSERERQNL